MLHIPEGELDALTSTVPELNPLDFLFWSPLKSLFKFASLKTSVNTVEVLIAQIVVTSEDIISTPDLVERVQQPFGIGCAMTYGTTTLNNSCSNHLVLHFYRLSVLHCSCSK
ncbi:hypothetical protein TNCV_3813461 [Trichonephila clavipes]|nr:hypothetical protein TNCV_3813461 [Trichonephila clavipes]